MMTNLKNGIDIAFNNNPGLLNFGSKQEYLNYIQSILSDLNIKDILFHGSTEDRWLKYNSRLGEYTLSIDKFDTSSCGVHFGTFEAAKQRIEINRYNADSYTMEMSKDIYIPVIINSTNIIRCEDQKDNWMPLERQLINDKIDVIEYINVREDKGSKSYNVIGDTDNIHILGSDTDMRKFKSFMRENIHKRTPSKVENITKEILSQRTLNPQKNKGLSM